MNNKQMHCNNQFGPAVSGDYVVAGALVFGKRGDVRRTYSRLEADRQ